MSSGKDYNYREIWQLALAQIELKLNSPVYFKTWFKGTQLIKIQNKIAYIGLPSSYSINWIKKKNHNLVLEVLKRVTKDDLEAEYIYDEDVALEVQESKSPTTANKAQLFAETGYSSPSSYKTNLIRAGLNVKYTFENFVIGNSNRLAHAAGIGVASNPGNSYNPLFIYGDSGVGKTHLMQAVGAEIIKNNENAKVIYCSSESFLNELVAAIRANNTQNFRNKYRRVDVLILDDIQFVSNWQETQNELFHTFNTLHQANKQIIFASDRPPHEIKNLEDRLKSRFQGGMVADISAPEFEHRLAIIRQKSDNMNIQLGEIIENYLAKNFATNIREIEGAMSKISLVLSVRPDHKLTIREIDRLLGRDAETKRKKMRVEDVIRTVGEYFGVDWKELKGDRRTALISFPRQVSMYILREEFKYPLEKVANYLNRKDHTTVIHAVDKIKSKMLNEPEFKTQIQEIRQQFNP